MKSGKNQGKIKGKCQPTNFGENGKTGEDEARESLLAEVQRQILLGHSKRDIVELIKSQGYTEDTGILYDEAIDTFKGITSDDPKVKLGFAEAALKMLYQKMMEIGDYTGALAALKEFTKLNKLGGVKAERPAGIQKYHGAG